ncbi:hypothetical protein BDV97DRAFT_283966, partial [Delphinella strobiligena]
IKYIRKDPRTLSALDAWAGSSKLVITGHYFWISGVPLQKSQQGLFRALLYGILAQCPDLIPTVCYKLWQSKGSLLVGSEPWTFDELSEAIGRIKGQRLVSEGRSVCFCFFIDGLDEFDGDHKELPPILNGLVDAQSIKICASSRPWNSFRNAFGGDTTKLLVLQDLTHQDVSIYTRSQPEKSPRLLEIQHEITEKASGMFLWVFLVIRGLSDSLENGDDMKELKRRVSHFPSDLDAYFRYMFEHYDEFYEAQVAQIFLV